MCRVIEKDNRGSSYVKEKKKSSEREGKGSRSGNKGKREEVILIIKNEMGREKRASASDPRRS